jgi:hypothetical protein
MKNNNNKNKKSRETKLLKISFENILHIYYVLFVIKSGSTERFLRA